MTMVSAIMDMGITEAMVDIWITITMGIIRIITTIITRICITVLDSVFSFSYLWQLWFAFVCLYQATNEREEWNIIIMVMKVVLCLEDLVKMIEKDRLKSEKQDLVQCLLIAAKDTQ